MYWSPPSRLHALVSHPSTLEQCYQRSLPVKFHQRHSGIFQFVRLLQQIDQYRSVDPRTPEGERILYPLVADWHRRASSLILHGTIDETWADCKRGWFRVKHPITININQQRLKMAYKKSQCEIVPGSVISAVARCHSPSLPKLITLCAVLQRMNGIEAVRPGRSSGRRRFADHQKHRLSEHRYSDRPWDLRASVADGNRREHRAAEFIYLPAFERAHITSTPAADTAAAA